MIIACPECSNPFEIADGHIAPLVQIECPTCSFRMILDFEAANDASLREDGMSIAQGFRDAASYRLAVGSGSAGSSVRPEPTAAVSAERPAIRQPPIQPPAEQPPVRQPVVELPAQPTTQPTAAQPDKPPVREPAPVTPVEPERPRSRPTLIAHTPPAPRPGLTVPQPAVTPAPVVEQVSHAQPVLEAEVETHIGPAPVGPEPSTFPIDEVHTDIDMSVEEPEEPPPVQPLGPSVRTPQHTPSAKPELTVAEMLQPDVESRTTKPSTDAADREQPANQSGKRSPAVTALMLVLLLILLGAGGLMTWSLITTGDPFQKILELTGQAEPAAPAAKPEAKADGKADGKATAPADAKSDAKSDG